MLTQSCKYERGSPKPVCPPLPHQNVLEGYHTMEAEALHREKALLGHCASAATRSGSIRELLLQNKLNLIKIENNRSYWDEEGRFVYKISQGHLTVFCIVFV